MKTKKIATRFSLVLALLLASYFASCDKEEWCVYCEWSCTSVKPMFGGTRETFCANSPEECEAEVQDWLDSRFIPSCWDCTEPYLK